MSTTPRPRIYDALAARWERTVGPLPLSPEGQVVGRLRRQHRMAAVPIFTHEDGRAYDTGDVRRVAKRQAAACGEDPAHFGARSYRVAGATDLKEIFGVAGQEYIKARGRWNSDIAKIYQRTIAQEQLDGAAHMTGASGSDLESLIIGWSQPATV